MKQPNDTLYQTLAAAERARLAFATLARGDHAELKRITDTCPQWAYRAPDYEYTQTVDRLFTLALSLECEGRGQIIELQTLRKTDPQAALLKVAEIKATAQAWREWCEAEGVHPADIYQTVTGEPSLWLLWADGLESVGIDACETVKKCALSVFSRIVEV